MRRAGRADRIAHGLRGVAEDFHLGMSPYRFFALAV
jgi:hypothetical protein